MIANLSTGCGLALLYPSLSLLVAASVPLAQRGVAMGAFTSFVDVGLGVGALAGGVITAAWSTEVAFGAAAAAAAAGGVVLAARAPRKEAAVAPPRARDRAPA